MVLNGSHSARRAAALFIVLSTASPLSARGPRGVVVEVADPGSPAAAAGFLPGDRIVAWSPSAPVSGEQAPVESVFQWMNVESLRSEIGSIRVTARRGGSRREMELTPGNWGLSVSPRMNAKARALFATGRSSGAEKGVQEGLEAWRNAESLLVRKREWTAAAWVALQECIARGKAGDLQGVKAALERACEDADRSGDPVVRWRARLSGGRALANLREASAAEALYREALQLVGEGSGGELEETLCLNDLGRLLFGRGDLAGTAEAFRRVQTVRSAAAPGTLCEGRACNNLGVVLQAQGRLAEARPFYERSLEIKHRLSPDTLDEALSINNFGILLQKSGDLEGAEQAYVRALVLKERLAPGTEDLAVSLNNLGALRQDRGDLPGAEAALTRALQIREAADPEGEGVAGTLLNLGLVSFARGDLEAAERRWRRALELDEGQRPGSLDVALALNNLAMLAVERGDLEEGERDYARALTIKRAQAPDSLELSSTLLNLSTLAMERGDLETARTRCEEALALRRRLAPDSVDVGEALVNLGDLEGRKGNPKAERTLYGEALEIFRRAAPGGLQEATVLHNMGSVCLETGEKAEARKHLLPALEIRRRYAPGSADLSATCRAMALLARKEGNRGEALACLREAVDALESQRGRLGGGAGAAERFSERFADTYRELVDLLAEEGESAEAFSALERYRARAFLDLLAERDLDFRKDAPEMLLREARLLDKAYDDRLAALADPDVERDETARQAAEAALAEVRTRQAGLAERIRLASPRLASLRYPQTLGLAEAAAALPPGCLLLSYSTGERTTVLFALLDGKLAQFVLPVDRATLSREVRAFRAAVTQPESEGPAIRRGGALYAKLLAPAAGPLSRAKSVLLCPDGPLHSMPWAVLRDGSGRYFGVRFAFARVSSATAFAEEHRRVGPPDWTVPLAAFGDPANAGVGRDLAPLPYSRVETERLCSMAGERARCFLGAEATESRAEEVDRSVRRIHFACHGLADERFPLDSGLFLAPPPAAGDNGFLQAWEVFESMRLDADLVTLSACETALGREMGGEGMVGLTRAFQYAGARNVLASLWRVSDESTAVFMERFYRHLLAGQTAAESLRCTREESLGLEEGGRHSRPFQWAAFELFGGSP